MNIVHVDIDEKGKLTKLNSEAIEDFDPVKFNQEALDRIVRDMGINACEVK